MSKRPNTGRPIGVDLPTLIRQVRKGNMKNLESIAKKTVLDFLKAHDDETEKEIGITDGERLANMVVFENKGGYIEMRIDEMLYDYMNLDGFECEYGYFENDFPTRFNEAIESAGLFCEPYSSDVYHITYDESHPNHWGSNDDDDRRHGDYLFRGEPWEDEDR